MKIPFDIKYRPQIESGEYKVETRDGKHVRILCYDANNIVPIVALVTFNDGSEGACHYYSNGAMSCEENPLDLFIVTQEEELTPFEKELVDILKCLSGRPSEQTYEDYAKEQTAQLLSLAREQFIKDGYVIEKKAFHDAVKKVDPKVMKKVSEEWNAMKEALRLEYERGKADALKDIPKWKRIKDINDLDFVENDIKLDKVIICPDKEGRMYYIYRTDLFEKLPKEDEK